ncbi:hypothetical protein, partial [Streptomyces sp. GbtcB7]|uniref:hypothetical protein n=1 Tax=Streptomyces sp. GbtcB7 TaxID=2824752 RepID=UPI001C2FAF18
ERRFPGGAPGTRQKQAENERGVISQRGFRGYSPVGAHSIMWAKRQGIAGGPGRGSAAGWLVGYAMGATALAPIPPGLISGGC